MPKQQKNLEDLELPEGRELSEIVHVDPPAKKHTRLKYEGYHQAVLDRAKAQKRPHGIPWKEDIDWVAKDLMQSITTIKTALRISGTRWLTGKPGVRRGTAHPNRNFGWFDAFIACYDGLDYEAIGEQAGTFEPIRNSDGEEIDFAAPKEIPAVYHEKLRAAKEREGQLVHAAMVHFGMYDASIDYVISALPEEDRERMKGVRPIMIVPGDYCVIDVPEGMTEKGVIKTIKELNVTAWLPVVSDCLRGGIIREIGERHGITKQQVSNIRRIAIDAGIMNAAERFAVREVFAQL